MVGVGVGVLGTHELLIQIPISENAIFIGTKLPIKAHTFSIFPYSTETV
jgi:hypothetical protein